MKKLNKQVQKSIEWIGDALLSIMETKSFAEISITEITERAGVSRLTFYRNFKSKEDIVRSLLSRITKDWTAKMDSFNGEEGTARELISDMFRMLDRNRRYLKLLFISGLEHIYTEFMMPYFNMLIGRSVKPENMDHFHMCFLSGGMLNVTVEWINDPRDMSAAELTEHIISQM
jgi:AcrR family transcriptional regulator